MQDKKNKLSELLSNADFKLKAKKIGVLILAALAVKSGFDFVSNGLRYEKEAKLQKAEEIQYWESIISSQEVLNFLVTDYVYKGGDTLTLWLNYYRQYSCDEDPKMHSPEIVNRMDIGETRADKILATRGDGSKFFTYIGGVDFPLAVDKDGNLVYVNDIMNRHKEGGTSKIGYSDLIVNIPLTKANENVFKNVHMGSSVEIKGNVDVDFHNNFERMYDLTKADRNIGLDNIVSFDEHYLTEEEKYIDKKESKILTLVKNSKQR